MGAVPAAKRQAACPRLPSFRHDAEHLLDAGELGDVYCVECWKLLRRSVKKGWHRLKGVAGGGVGMDSAPHRIDVALYLLDTPDVVSLVARTYARFADRTVPSRGHLLRDVEEGLTGERLPHGDTSRLKLLVSAVDGAKVSLYAG